MGPSNCSCRENVVDISEEGTRSMGDYWLQEGIIASKRTSHRVQAP